MNDRNQFVSVNGDSFLLCNITCAVPQGSVLGPLLFLLCLNAYRDIKAIKFPFCLLTTLIFSLKVVMLLI